MTETTITTSTPLPSTTSLAENVEAAKKVTEKPTAKKRSRGKRKTPKTFKDAYQVLKHNAAALQQQDEPDIDNLMKTVEDSIVAYKVCQERINAVQQALDEAFASDSTVNAHDE